MLLIKVTHLLAKELLSYKGEKQTHSIKILSHANSNIIHTVRYIKQKNEIARQLLLATFKANVRIQDNHLFLLQEGMALYSKLITAQSLLMAFKNNTGGELDSIVNKYVKKLEKILFKSGTECPLSHLNKDRIMVDNAPAASCSE